VFSFSHSLEGIFIGSFVVKEACVYGQSYLRAPVYSISRSEAGLCIRSDVFKIACL